MAAGAAVAEALGGGSGIIQGLEGIFGTSGSTGGTKSATRSGTTTETMQLDEAAIAKIIQDVLGSTQGLASIFGGEQATGLYGSSVAAQEAGNFAAQLVGELAKLTGKKITTSKEDESATSTGSTETGGLLDQVGIGGGSITGGAVGSAIGNIIGGGAGSVIGGIGGALGF